jgi:hypothetical protein
MKTLELKVYPKNKEHLLKLIDFAKKIQKICRRAGAEPLAYGSLAYLLYSQDKEVKIGDIDFLLHEECFSKLMALLKQNWVRYRYFKKYKMFQVFNDGLKIELDSFLPFQKKYFSRANYLKLNGLNLKIVNLKDITNMYKRAARLSKDNPEGNRKKFEVLKRLR